MVWPSFRPLFKRRKEPGFGRAPAVAMFPLGIALVASGLLDQRLLMRARSLEPEGRSVAG